MKGPERFALVVSPSSDLASARIAGRANAFGSGEDARIPFGHPGGGQVRLTWVGPLPNDAQEPN